MAGAGYGATITAGGGGATIDPTAADITQVPGVQAAGAVGLAADSGHVHPGNFNAAAPAQDAAGGTAGAAANIARGDHAHQLNVDATLPLVESGAGAAGTATTYSRRDHVHPALAGGSVTQGEVKLGADVATVQNVWTTVLSIASLAAGTYAVDAYATVAFGAGSTDVEFRLQDTTNNVTLASQQNTDPTTANTEGFSLSKRNYAPAGVWTLALQINTTSATASTAKAATPANGSGNNATGLGWIKTA